MIITTAKCRIGFLPTGIMHCYHNSCIATSKSCREYCLHQLNMCRLVQFTNCYLSWESLMSKFAVLSLVKPIHGRSFHHSTRLGLGAFSIWTEWGQTICGGWTQLLTRSLELLTWMLLVPQTLQSDQTYISLFIRVLEQVSVSAKLYDFIHFLWLNEAPVGELQWRNEVVGGAQG